MRWKCHYSHLRKDPEFVWYNTSSNSIVLQRCWCPWAAEALLVLLIRALWWRTNVLSYLSWKQVWLHSALRWSVSRVYWILEVFRNVLAALPPSWHHVRVLTMSSEPMSQLSIRIFTIMFLVNSSIISEPGLRSRYSDWLRAGRPRGRNLSQEFSLFHVVHAGSGAHPDSYPMGTGGSFSRGKAARAWSWPLTSN
jgi:hypothetical protein